ncbi:virB8 family protein [Variovorax paradoxus]|uniref:Type IV secretion system protein virB8 n=1 Tax=Variovorax paradoxus TaxID=34073 RepID=A0A679JH16_VARPD|nr:Type IV secretion system protein virB8 [Variovorax paradoxus]
MQYIQGSAGLAIRRAAADQRNLGEWRAVMDKQVYFAAAVDWDAQRRLDLERRAARSTGIAWVCAVLSGLSMLSVSVLLPLKQFVPAVIRVDNATGAYDVQAPGELVRVGLARDQKILLSDVARYVLAREGFTRGEAETNYRTAYLMSCGPVRGEWEAYFNPHLNAQSPVNTMSATDSERAEILNVTFLPTDREDLRVTQVRFDKTVTRGVSPPVRTRYISTLTVQYDASNVPAQIKDLQINAFGFCAMNYRRDQEGAPQVLTSTAASGELFGHPNRDADAAAFSAGSSAGSSSATSRPLAAGAR